MSDNMDVTDQDSCGSGEIDDCSLPTWAKCSICCQKATGEEVQVMPCLHLLCSPKCVQTASVRRPKSGAETVSCKTCIKFYSKKDLARYAYILECQERARDAAILKKLKNPKCSYCIRGHNAVVWCGICDEYMCESCKDHHGFAKKTRDHKIEQVDQKTYEIPGGTDGSNTKCNLHDGKEYTHFCNTCARIVCNECCTKRHQDHVTEPLKDLAADTKSSIQRNLNKMKSMLPTYEQIENILANKAEQMLKTQHSFLVTEASAQLTRLLSALMKREMEQRKELSETVVLKSREFSLKKFKIKSLIAQTQHFIDFSEDLLKDGSDWAIVSNRQLIESQLCSLVGSADQFGDAGKVEAYTEKGFNFVMDKSVGHQAERHINLTAKITYSFNPKAPTEIKIRSAGLQNRNLGAGTPVNKPSLANKSKFMAQNPSPPPTVNVMRSYARSPRNEGHVAEVAGSSLKQVKPIPKVKPGSLAEVMAAHKGKSNLVDQYANLTDQLIIEPIDDDSEIEDDPIEHKSDGDETDVLQDVLQDVEQGKPHYDTQVRAKRGRKPYASARNQSNRGKKVNNSGRSSTINGSDSEEGSNKAPNLSPEPMKTPPKLKRVAESVKAESFGVEDGENPNDAPPPVLVPSVNIPDRAKNSATADGSLGTVKNASASNLGRSARDEDFLDQTSSNNLEKLELEPSTRRSRRKSGVHTQHLPDDFDFSGPSTSTRRRRGSVASEMSEVSESEADDPPGNSKRRGRSRSRNREEVAPDEGAQLPSKRERKKKTDPQFVVSTVVYKKRGRSATKETGTPPSPNPSTSSPSDSKRGRRSRGRGRGRRRNRSVGRPRKSEVSSDLEDNCN